jgi:hypothetical protein
MSKRHPRIYVYKITFEEIMHYYYGVHKEVRFNNYYMGSPKTHKWMWDFYTPQKQILQFFDYTDEGYYEALKIEERLIKPVYNTDPYCLNETCGVKMSLNVLRKSGLKHKENKTGIFSYSKDEMIKRAKEDDKKRKELGIGFYKIPKEDKVKIGRINGLRNKELKLGIFAMSPEEKSKVSKKAIETQKRNNTGFYGIPKEKRSNTMKEVNSQKYKCLVTGFITNPGALSSYQKARGIDTSLRERVN